MNTAPEACSDGSIEVLLVAAATSECQQLAALLSQHGYRIDVQSRCGQVQAQLACGQIPVAVLVITTSEPDFLADFTALSQAAEAGHIPLLCLAGSTETRPEVDYLAAGAVDYLPAPWSAAELLARLTARCACAQRMRQLQAENTQLRQGSQARDRHHAEMVNALSDSESHYRALVEALPDLLIRMDVNGIYLDAIPGRDTRMQRPIAEKLAAMSASFCLLLSRSNRLRPFARRSPAMRFRFLSNN